ncbi:hypothetical protein BS50DRAFT_568593 [Corynespora cassiicola Philippines]|uniref:Uncharacterized protein n=1 Tax=Corynespora cassiicola Philippines TaxID=1448308 RepID=A0A2T2P6P1_CORCC|nr:hypothetical protein BS50DRAFT_568593 [Corynespora cassiicola Philippines]
MNSVAAQPAIFRLPIELRYEIYDQLCPNKPLCYPFPNSPITSIDHGGPPRALLLTCKALSDEVRTYYYGIATFRFLALGNAWSRGEHQSQGTMSAIKNARKVELMCMWNITDDRAASDPATWPWYMNGWLAAQVRLLHDEAENLKLVQISLRDASSGIPWDLKKPLLEPLLALKGKVAFSVGQIVAADEEEDGTKAHVKRFVSQLNN